MKVTVGLTLETVVYTGLKGKYGHSGKAVYASVGDVAVEKVAKERFALEADTLSKCQGHPNIITCHAIEHDIPCMYIITELGIGTYDDVLNKTYTGPTIGDFRNQLYQITKGLAHIHGLGCVHRDLKPLNIQISLPVGNGVPMLKLANFGLSRVPDGLDEESFPLGSLAGCDLWFMAPEVYNSKEFIWFMDIFSLGCIWTMALSLSHPFGSKGLAVDRIKKKRPIKLTLNDFKNVEGDEAELVFALVKSMLSFNPYSRPTALDILQHPYLAHLEEEKQVLVARIFPTSQQEESGIIPKAVPTSVVTHPVEELENSSDLSDLKPNLVVEESGHFESKSGATENALDLVVKEEIIRPSSPSELNETADNVPYSEMIVIQQPQQSPVTHSTSSNEKMEVVESPAEQHEEEPCSELDALNPTPADNYDGNADEGCPSSLTPLPSPRLYLTSDSASNDRLKPAIPPELLNVTLTKPPGDKELQMPFSEIPEQDHSRDISESMEVDTAVDPSVGSTQSVPRTDSELVNVNMSAEEEPSTSSTTRSSEISIVESQGENELTPPPEEVATTEAALPVIITSPDQSTLKSGKAIRQKAPPKMKAPKATKSRRSTSKKQAPNKRAKVDSSEVTEEQESMEETPLAACPQDPSQIRSPALPDDEPSSSSQLPDTQLGEGLLHSPYVPLADEYGLNVQERVQVGMLVTFIEGGFERLSDLEEGDTGVVLSIDSAGSLNDFNVEVDWQTKGICSVRYQQIKLSPAVSNEATCDMSRNESPIPSLSPFPLTSLTVIIPEDTPLNTLTSQETPSPPQLVSLSMNHLPVPVLQLPSSQTSPPSPPVPPVEEQVTTPLLRSAHNLRSKPSLLMTSESPPIPSTSTLKSKQSVRKSIQSKPPKKVVQEMNPTSSKSKKKLLPHKEDELLNLSSQSSLSDEKVTRFVEILADTEVNVNCKRYSSTPILILCRSNPSESLYPCLKSILAREDVDLKMTTSQGNNALMLLSRYYPLSNPLIDCIRLLVNHGFDINEKNKDKKPALFLLSQNPSTSKNLIDVARLLINEKSDFKIAHKAAVALQKRGLQRDGDILSKIIDSYVPGLGRVNNNKEEELLKLCCLFSFTEQQLKRFGELILDKEVDLNCVDNNNRSPLILLCRHLKSERLAEFLSSLFNRCSIDPNIKDNDQWNALISACYYYHNQHLIEVVRLLLARGIDVKAITSRGSNALYALCCIHCGDVPNVTEVIRSLLDAGVEINGEKSVLFAWCVNNIRTPNFIPVVRLLIERGIDLERKDERGRNCLMLICDQHKNGNGLLNIVRLLIENHVNVDARDNEGLNVVEILNNRPIVIDPEVIQLLKGVMSNNYV